MSDLRLHAQLPIDPQSFLDPESARVIRNAHRKADEIILTVEADLESRGIDRDSQKAITSLNKAKFKGAELVLGVIAERLGAIAPCPEIFREWMEGEIEAACNTLELHDTQSLLLNHKFRNPPAGSPVPEIDPFIMVLRAIDDRITERKRVLALKHDESAKKILELSFEGACIERARKRLDIYQTHATAVAMAMVDVYLSAVSEFSAHELLSLMRLDHFRQSIQETIQREGIVTNDLNQRDCGHRSTNHQQAEIRLWKIQGGIMDMVVNRLRIATSSLIALRATPVPRPTTQAPALMKQQPKLVRTPLQDLPKRAAWVKERLKERGWDQNDPYTYGGPDRKTTLRILEGKRTQAGSIVKLVDALNKKRGVPSVSLKDVPDD